MMAGCLIALQSRQLSIKLGNLLIFRLKIILQLFDLVLELMCLLVVCISIVMTSTIVRRHAFGEFNVRQYLLGL
jgi:hypothetical protein